MNKRAELVATYYDGKVSVNRKAVSTSNRPNAPHVVVFGKVVYINSDADRKACRNAGIKVKF